MELENKLDGILMAYNMSEPDRKYAKQDILHLFSSVGKSEQYYCELFDFKRCEQKCEKQCDSCYWMESKKL